MVLFLLIPLFSSGCGEEKGSSPILKNLTTILLELQQGTNDGMMPVGGTIAFEDPDKDVVLYRVSKQDCGQGPRVDQDNAMAEFHGMSEARFFFFMNISTECVHGEYFIEVSVFDSQGHQSNSERVFYRICEFYPCDV